ncbi:MAG: penicillin-binding transpeptidase domain-containing protein [Eubacteriales bacterium]|nr:penicillin-binding transpeptidase domain-containing protein [Eubacteriales bacterium]
MFRRIKEFIFDTMQPRYFFMTAFITGLFVILIGRLFLIQILKGDEYSGNHKKRIEKEIVIPGVRGKIFDRNGKLLAYNKMSKSLVVENVISDNNLNEKEYNETVNRIAIQVVRILNRNAEQMNRSVPIVINSTGNYEFSVYDQTLLQNFLKNAFNKQDVNQLTPREKSVTADQFVRAFAFGKADEELLESVTCFHLPEDLTQEEVLQVLNIRFNMFLNRFRKYRKKVVAENLSDRTIVDITENKANLPGVTIEDRMTRIYNDAYAMSNIIGYVGPATGEEPDSDANDMIGKMGIEKNLNDVLKPENGSRKIYVDSIGNVIEEGDEVRPGTGEDVYLSIDADYQRYIYNLLEDFFIDFWLKHMTPSMNIKKDVRESDTYWISAGEIYDSILSNGLINLHRLRREDATETERKLMETLDAGAVAALDDMKSALLSETPMKDMDEQKYVYVKYFNKVMREEKILLADGIDESDKIPRRWLDNEISPKEYLYWLISENHIDTNSLEMEEKYSSTEEVSKRVIDKVTEIIRRRTDFIPIISKNMVRAGTFNGTELLTVLYDQGVLPKDDMYEQFKGGVDPYEFLRELISSKRLTPGQLAVDPFSAAVTVNDPHTGKVLAMVSYPGYDSNKMGDDNYITYLLSTGSTPMINRPTGMMKAPGSTYKPLTEIAALTEGIIGAGDGVVCTGQFDRVTPSPKCWVYPNNHGTVNAVTGLANSCNVYFNELGWRFGLQNGYYNSERGLARMAEYAKMFGLDRTTGLEIDEAVPKISDDNAIFSAIGQGSHLYNITNLNRYFSVIANGGDVLEFSVVNKTVDTESGQEHVYEPKEPEHITLDSNALSTVRQGLIEVVKKSYNAPSFEDVGAVVAGKTGTAEENLARNNHSLFVGYVPAEAPEIVSGIILPNIPAYTYHTDLSGKIMKYYIENLR